MFTVTFFNTGRKLAQHERKLKKLVKAVCTRFKVTDAKISIAIVDNKQIRKINEKFLRRRTATDCIAFDLSDLKGGHKYFEIVVNGQKAESQSRKRRHSILAEIALYITHGLLHNLGFNDLSPKNARAMHRLEDEILQKEGFGRVYKDTD